MTNDDFDYSAYVGLGHNSGENALSELSQLAEDQHKAEIKVTRLEAELKIAQEELRQVAERALPEKMEELGLSEYKTTGGLTVEVSEKIRASLTVDNRQKGHYWLEKNKFGGLIKTNVVVSFSRGQLYEAQEFVARLRIEGKLANLERKVEPSTLTAFVKEQLTQGKEIPLDVFGVFRQRVAKVKA